MSVTANCTTPGTDNTDAGIVAVIWLELTPEVDSGPPLAVTVSPVPNPPPLMVINRSGLPAGTTIGVTLDTKNCGVGRELLAMLVWKNNIALFAPTSNPSVPHRYISNELKNSAT